MSEVDFLRILKAVNSDADGSWLAVEIQDTPLDSLDLLELRSLLEIRLQRGIPDTLWFEAASLEDLLSGINKEL